MLDPDAPTPGPDAGVDPEAAEAATAADAADTTKEQQAAEAEATEAQADGGRRGTEAADPTPAAAEPSSSPPAMLTFEPRRRRRRRRSTPTRCAWSRPGGSTTSAPMRSTRPAWRRSPRTPCCACTPTTSIASGWRPATWSRPRRPRGRCRCPCTPDATVGRGAAAVTVLPARRNGRRAHRRHRTGHRDPRGEGVNLDPRPRPAPRRRHRPRGGADRPPQGRRHVRAAARVGALHDLVRAQGARRHVEPARPQPRRALRDPADPRRRHQVLLQGGPAARPGRQGACSSSPRSSPSSRPSSCSR